MLYMERGGGVRIEPFGAGEPTPKNDYERTHDLIHGVNERLFELQLKQAERMSELAFRVADNSVQLLKVVAEASATILGKTANGKEAADSLLDLIKKIKSEFSGPAGPGGGVP